jgi:SAM-dependent methyltransferase
MFRGGSWLHFSHRLSAIFTEKLGLSADERCGIVKGVEYFPARLREVVALCQKKFPNETLKVLDVGCGRYSFLQTIKDLSPEVIFYGMDVSEHELADNKFPMNFIVYDACNNRYREDLKGYESSFHLVISHSFLEHVADAKMTHSLIYFLLKPGGVAYHSFPTLYDPLLFIGSLLPAKLVEIPVLLFEPWRKQSGKFKTYYHKCRCDSRQIRRWFDSLGYTCLEYRDFFGTGYFYALFPVQWMLDIFYWLVIKIDLKFLSSLAVVTLEKKDSGKLEYEN